MGKIEIVKMSKMKSFKTLLHLESCTMSIYHMHYDPKSRSILSLPFQLCAKQNKTPLRTIFAFPNIPDV